MYNKELSRQLRKAPTKAERILWQHLRYRQMRKFKFRRQHPIGRYIVDFICLEVGLVIELDGGQHNEEKNLIYDTERTKWLEEQGLKVLRFWNHDVLSELASVKAPTLTLPLKGGGKHKKILC